MYLKPPQSQASITRPAVVTVETRLRLSLDAAREARQALCHQHPIGWQYRRSLSPCWQSCTQTPSTHAAPVLPPQPGLCAARRRGWPSLLGHCMGNMLGVYFGAKLCGRLRRVFLKCTKQSVRSRSHRTPDILCRRKKAGIMGHGAGGCCLYSQMNRFAKVVF